MYTVFQRLIGNRNFLHEKWSKISSITYSSGGLNTFYVQNNVNCQSFSYQY